MALIAYVTRIQFDFGAIRLLPEELSRLGVARPLIVTDAGVRQAGLVERAAASLRTAPPVFDGTPGNPTEAAAESALALYRAEACDGVVALGGGSAIDLAKAVGLLATHGGALGDYAITGGGSDRIGEIAPSPMAGTARRAGTC